MILLGDCIKLMKLLKPNSIDTIITDPPYGLSFMSKKWDYDVPSIDLWKKCLEVLKPGGTALVFAGSRTQHRMACNIEDAGFILKDVIMWLYGSGFPKGTDISKQLDKGIERKIIDKGKNGKIAIWDTNRCKGEFDITKPATPEAKLWNGWKSHALKPAYEPIIVAMKPNKSTYANNALQWGVSGLNIDGGRIETKAKSFTDKRDDKIQKNTYGKYGIVDYDGSQGRFPANIILDEKAAEMLDEQTGQNTSRFFYCAKASKSERGESNNHPTVKPLKLIEYLCKLTKTPTGGIVLDPFAGSGTTGIACQNTGRDYILMEKEREYWEIAKRRVRVKNNGTEES